MSFVVFLIAIVFGLAMSERAEKGGAGWLASTCAGIGGAAVVVLISDLVGLT